MWTWMLIKFEVPHKIYWVAVYTIIHWIPTLVSEQSIKIPNDFIVCFNRCLFCGYLSFSKSSQKVHARMRHGITKRSIFETTTDPAKESYIEWEMKWCNDGYRASMCRRECVLLHYFKVGAKIIIPTCSLNQIIIWAIWYCSVAITSIDLMGYLHSEVAAQSAKANRKGRKKLVEMGFSREEVRAAMRQTVVCSKSIFPCTRTCHTILVIQQF